MCRCQCGADKNDTIRTVYSLIHSVAMNTDVYERGEWLNGFFKWRRNPSPFNICTDININTNTVDTLPSPSKGERQKGSES